MTVAKLIEKLQLFDPDADVKIAGYRLTTGCDNVYEIKSVKIGSYNSDNNIDKHGMNKAVLIREYT